jgi:hypothetical protein
MIEGTVQKAEERSRAGVGVENGLPRALSVRAYVSGSGATMAGIAVTVFCIFLPAVIVPYGDSDDYAYLAMAKGLGPSPWLGKSVIDGYAVNGRVFAGLLESFFFSAVGTIDNLRFVRLVAVVGIAALALLLHWALVRAGIKRTASALIAVLVCTMPAFQVYGSWAVLFFAPWAALLAGGASLLAAAAAEGPRDLELDRMVGATGLLLAALLIYQPPAMFFWVFLAVALVGAIRESGRSLRIVRAHLGVAAVALSLAFVVLKLGVHLVGKTAPNAGRNALTHDVVGKAHWFFEWPLFRSLNLFDLTPSRWLASLVATVAAGGILLLLRHVGVRPLIYVVIAASLIPLSFLPNLLVAENSPTYRTEAGISSLIALYFGLGAIGIWLTVRDWLGPRVSGRTLVVAERLALAVSVAFVATSAFVAAKNVTTLYVGPQSTELRMVRSQVAALPPGVERVGFVLLGRDQGMTKFVTDEFGLSSSQAPWTPEPLVLLILREEGRLPPGAPHPTIDLLPPYTTTLPANEPVVDVRGLQRLR